jgi:hypothetical protein
VRSPGAFRTHRAAGEARAVVRAEHAAALCAGHFPGEPLVPGRIARRAHAADLAAKVVAPAVLAEIERCLFLRPVTPRRRSWSRRVLARATRVRVEIHGGRPAGVRARLPIRMTLPAPGDVLRHRRPRFSSRRSRPSTGRRSARARIEGGAVALAARARGRGAVGGLVVGLATGALSNRAVIAEYRDVVHGAAESPADPVRRPRRAPPPPLLALPRRGARRRWRRRPPLCGDARAGPAA